MSTTSSSPLPALHMWPGQWGISSFDPLCLAAVLFLQTAIPGKYTVTETSNPDSSPTGVYYTVMFYGPFTRVNSQRPGQLPFLVHGQHTVTSFPSIIKYVAGLRNAEYETYPDADVDVHLTPRERSLRTAWSAHAESHLGDLVYHSLYSNQDNWTKLTAAALGSLYPIPQKYYVPRRIRDGYHLRLLTAGLWQAFVEDTEKSKESPFSKEAKPPTKEELAKNPTMARAFNKEKILEKARATLDIYQELLGDRQFFFNKWLSTLDVLVAAHILLLTEVPYPDTTLKNLVTTTYPSLCVHSKRVYSSAFGQGKPRITSSPHTSPLWALVPSLPRFYFNTQSPQSVQAEDAHYRNARMGFIGLTLGTVVTYMAINIAATLKHVHHQ